MPRTSCSLDQGNCSGNCAYQCVRWDDGVRGHLVEVFERKIKSKTDDEHIETQALSSLLMFFVLTHFFYGAHRHALRDLNKKRRVPNVGHTYEKRKYTS